MALQIITGQRAPTVTTFDPAKNGSNLAKHGIDLAAAEGFDWETSISFEDRDSA
jgi:uncharacterized DUF497 family protein